MFFIPTRKERFSESGEEHRQVWDTLPGLQRSCGERLVPGPSSESHHFPSSYLEERSKDGVCMCVCM